MTGPIRSGAERGIALMAVLFALTLLMLLALPFAVSMGVGADAARRDLEQTVTEQASASVRDLLLADVQLSHPAIDPTPGYDGLDEFPTGVVLPEAFAALGDDGRTLLGGEVVDQQRFLSLDGASPLVLATVLGTATRLREDLVPDATSIAVESAANLPESGYVVIGDEIVRYESRDDATLLGCERGQFRDSGYAAGTDTIAAEAPVVDYRCVLATSWPFFGRGDGSRSVRTPFRSVGELAEIERAEQGKFLPGELDKLERCFTVDAMATTSPVFGRPERVFGDLEPGGRELTLRSALHVGPGSTVRLRNLRSGAKEFGLVIATAARQSQDLMLPSIFTLRLLHPVLGSFPGVDTVVEPLVPAPVNLNTASEEVLRAVFADVRRATDLQVVEASGRRQPAPPYISRTLAQELAADVVAMRQGAGNAPSAGGPFTGWRDLIERLFTPRLEGEGNNAGRARWTTLYRNLRTGRDSTVELGTSPICFDSGPWVRYRAAASASRSLVSQGLSGRHERTGRAAAVPGFRIEHAWATQQQFEEAFVLDRRSPFWVTSPINLGHLQPNELGNDPASRYFPHLVPIAFSGLGLGAPRYPVDDPTDAATEPAVSSTPSGRWGPTHLQAKAYDAFSQANHRRGHDLVQNGPYQMNNTGPQSSGGAGTGSTTTPVAAGNSGGNNRHDQVSFPFSAGNGYMARFGMGFWLEPQSLQNVYVFDHGDGTQNRNRLSLLARDGFLTLEVLDEAGLDPNFGDSPAGVQRTASQARVAVGDLALPADTPVHLNFSATTGRPADLSMFVDGFPRAKPQHVTYLAADLPVLDPSLNNNQRPPTPNSSGSGNGFFLDIPVESTEGFPPVGVLRIGLELFEYSAINGNSFRCQWNDSLGGRAARMIGREFRPSIPVDNNGKPTVDINDPMFQGVNLDVFPMHPTGSVVELYGYSAMVSENTATMVGSTNVAGTLGGWAVARGNVQNAQQISIQLQGGLSIPIGRGITQQWTGDIDLLVPTANALGQSGSGGLPAQAGNDITDAFPSGGGYALLVQYSDPYQPPIGQVGTATTPGGMEVIRYTSRQGSKLSGVQRAQQVPGNNNQIPQWIFSGQAKEFVTDWLVPIAGGGGNTLNHVPTHILWVVPISLAVANTGVLWDPQTTGVTEWVQLYPQGGASQDLEWVRYDAILGNAHILRVNRAAWFNLFFQLTQQVAQTTQNGNQAQNWGTTPPWPQVTATAGFIGYTPQIESTYPQIHAARRALQFRGDPRTGTTSHTHTGSQVTQCNRLQLNWGNYGAYTGRVGRHDRVAMVQGSLSSGSSRPNVEWHTVAWQMRRYESDNLQQGTPSELMGPWPFQLVAFKDAVRVPLLGPPTGTVIDDPRRFDRIVKYPSGELPSAWCQNPLLGGSTAGENAVRGIVDELEIVQHLAEDLILDATLDASAMTFTVERAYHMSAAGAVWSPTDLSAAFPLSGGLVQIDEEIVAYQSVQNGQFQVAQNGRGLLNTTARGHDRGARVKFLTHRPAAILAGGVGPEESRLPVQAIGPLPPAGTLLLGNELLHYCWGRKQQNTLEMPRWYPPEEGSSSRGEGLFRGRYGTRPQAGSSGQVVIGWPFRYWDRYHEGSDDPELAYSQLTVHEAPGFFRTLRWREETRDARVDVLCRVRTDGIADWTADAATTAGLWQFQSGSDSRREHVIDRQAAQLEIRFMTVYRAGAIDTQTYRSHGWKTTGRVEDVRVEYEGQSRVFDERVTAR